MLIKKCLGNSTSSGSF